MSAERSFVFYDPSGRRWIHFRRGLQTAGIFLILVTVLVAIAWLVNPQLPALGLPQVQHLPATISEVPVIISGQKAARNIPFRMRRAAKHIQYQRSNSPVMHPKLAGHVSAGKPVIFGFYVNWDPGSMVSLRLNLAHLTHLAPEWLTLANGKGDVTDQTDQAVVTIAEEAKLPILALISNYRDGWRGGEVHQAITNPDARANLIDNIYSNLREHHFQGVNIDFEDLSPRDREPLVVFMRELYGKLHPEGLLVTESTPADDPAFDLTRLAQYNDYVLPMLYDEHYQSGSPGPVASEDWFDDQLERLAKVVPPDKAVVGIGNYGYDWKIGGHGGAEMSFGDVVAAALGNNGELHWDAEQNNPVLRYAAGKERHEVWFLDAVTALNQVLHVADYGFRGVGVWRLGGEDPGLWRVLNPDGWPGTSFDPQPLSVLSANKVPNRYGEGEVLHISQTPQDGGRNVTREADGDYQETYLRLPSYWVIERTGAVGGKFKAITFDDGPDPKWTPKILDVLHQRNVRATFFIIGANAEQSMGLLRREYAEGNELGNHTYSHPNIAAMGEERTKLELSWTQRIIEHSIGVSTTLFRPPYNADSQPETPEEILPVWRAQRAGYVTIAESIDPRDWEVDTTPEKILSEVREDRNEGAVILLHDGGGDRSATLAALPLIIDYFRGQGYQFLPVGELIGRTRAQVMPVPSSEEMRWAHIEGQAFGVQSNFKKVVGILFLWAIYLSVMRSLVYGFLALIQKFRARRRTFVAGYRPPVSVIIAAYNEEKVILRTVESALHSGYDDLEIVVVNDGSTDSTLQLLQSHYGDHPQVRILDQPNGGKSAALNSAIACARNEILVAMDADTILRRGTVEKLVRHFSDPRIGAVSGNARVGNRKKWITRFQSIEYIYGFNLDRRALDLVNAITVVPGAVGAWRKTLIQELGGFGHDTLAEDTDLTLAIRRGGHIIRYEEEAVAFTEAPEDVRSLAKQRFRWAFGTLQAAWKHRDALFVPRYGSLGFIALPSIWLFQVLLSALSPFAEIAMLLALYVGNWRIVLVYYVMFFLVELLTGLIAYRLEGEKPWDLGLLFFQRILYRELMYYVLAKSLLFAVEGRLVGWGKLERRASVQGTP